MFSVWPDVVFYGERNQRQDLVDSTTGEIRNGILSEWANINTTKRGRKQPLAKSMKNMDKSCQDFRHTKAKKHCAGIVVFLYCVMRWQFNLKRNCLSLKLKTSLMGISQPSHKNKINLKLDLLQDHHLKLINMTQSCRVSQPKQVCFRILFWQEIWWVVQIMKPIRNLIVQHWGKSGSFESDNSVITQALKSEEVHS